jgi:hypothetical protein
MGISRRNLKERDSERNNAVRWRRLRQFRELVSTRTERTLHYVYAVSQEESSVLWEVIISVILSDESVYVHVSYSERFLR